MDKRTEVERLRESQDLLLKEAVRDYLLLKRAYQVVPVGTPVFLALGERLEKTTKSLEEMETRYGLKHRHLSTPKGE